jgi:hypothetical protein
METIEVSLAQLVADLLTGRLHLEELTISDMVHLWTHQVFVGQAIVGKIGFRETLDKGTILTIELDVDKDKKPIAWERKP